MTANRRRRTITRYVVAKDYYRDSDSMRDEFPILYATEAEAEAMMAKLEAGSDISFYDRRNEDEAAVLFIDTVEIPA